VEENALHNGSGNGIAHKSKDHHAEQIRAEYFAE